MEIRKLEKNGNSTALNLPSKYLSSLNLATGDYVRVELTVDRKIIITEYEKERRPATP